MVAALIRWVKAHLVDGAHDRKVPIQHPKLPYCSIDLINGLAHNAAVDVFRALSDPTRRAILTLLASGEHSAGEIVAEFSITAPAVSQHLKGLREAGLVRVRVEAQRRIYCLDPAGIDEARKWLAGLQPSARLEAVALARPSVIEMVQGRRFFGRVA